MPSDTATAENGISEVKGGLRAMEEEGVEIATQLEALQLPVHTSHHRIAHMHNSYALIHQLPVEMLGAIFLAGAMTWDYYRLIISHICQHWRIIAIS